MVFRNFMKGVFQIAGTDSNYLIYYVYVALMLILVSSIFLIYSLYEATKINVK